MIRRENVTLDAEDLLELLREADPTSPVASLALPVAHACALHRLREQAPTAWSSFAPADDVFDLVSDLVEGLHHRGAIPDEKGQRLLLDLAGWRGDHHRRTTAPVPPETPPPLHVIDRPDAGENDDGWHLLGHVGIDTARMALVDPCALDLIDDEAFAAVLGSVGHCALHTRNGIPVGVMVATGMGDGTYPVEGRLVRFAGDPPGRCRIAEVRIRFRVEATEVPA